VVATMSRIIVVLVALSLGTPGCTQRGIPDAPASAPSVTNGGPPEIGQGVSGQVMDDSGRPIARALVQPRSLDANSPAIPEIAVFSDANGQYAWRLSPGRYELTVTMDGFQPITMSAVVTSSQVTKLDFTLQRPR
jgi:hypothetical protein